MKKYKLALFIGRFQPFHKGHLYSLQKAIEVGERVLIGIGSSQESGTRDNPWSYEEREKAIRDVVCREIGSEWRGKVEIVGIPDTPSDKEWAENIKLQITNYKLQMQDVVVVGNNDWTNGVLSGVGMQILESGLYNRDKLEGVKIREMMRKEDGRWRERVPKVVRQLVRESRLA